MLVVCNGMPRSASTWSFNVALGLLKPLAPAGGVYSAYDESMVRFLESVPPATAHALVKCHELDAHGRALAQTGTAKVIYTWRDPADAVASCMRMFSHDFGTALACVEASLDLYAFHQRCGTALILDYERIVVDPLAAVQRIAAFLELDERSDAIRAVTEETSLPRMKEKAEALPDEAHLIALCGFPHDPETLLHPHHIRDGGSGYGRKLLTADQLERIPALSR